MRIDRALHCIRLVKTRTLAQRLIETGYVRVDGKRVEKSSAEVRAGSIIAMPLQGKVRIVRILGLPQHRVPAREAYGCYEELGVDENRSPS